MPREDRLDRALSKLIEQTVPVYQDDDTIAIEQRLDDAYGHAYDLIDK